MTQEYILLSLHDEIVNDIRLDYRNRDSYSSADRVVSTDGGNGVHSYLHLIKVFLQFRKIETN